MNKAILILDEMPECCEECRLINSHYDNEYGWQTYCGWDYHRIREKNKRYFCPLKELPQKKDAFEEHMKVESNERYISESLINQIRGYNFCIDEILGGNDE